MTDPNKIVDMCDEITPVKDKLYTPKMPGAEDDIKNLTLNKAHEWYGDPLPDIVQKRVDKELKSVIGNGFSVIYLISQKLVAKSNKDGYLVGLGVSGLKFSRNTDRYHRGQPIATTLSLSKV